MTTNTMQLKLINTELIKSTLKNMDSGTKNTLSDATGLSTATCRNILNELVASGEVMETSLEPSTGGRPSRRFVYNENYALVCAIYIRLEDSEKTLYATIANLAGTAISEQELHPDEITIESITALIRDKLRMFPKIQTASIGIPGVVSSGVIDNCDVRELAGANLQQILTQQLNLPVIVENDMNCTAAGFLRANEHKDLQNIAYLYYPENGCPGCGIIINGKIIYGSTNFAGELSFLPLGIAQEQLGAVQKERGKFSGVVARSLASLICIINPEKIIIAGRMFNTELNNAVKTTLKMLIPEKHIPELIFLTDVHDNFIRGLISLALEQLSCGLEVVSSSLRKDS